MKSKRLVLLLGLLSIFMAILPSALFSSATKATADISASHETLSPPNIGAFNQITCADFVPLEYPDFPDVNIIKRELVGDSVYETINIPIAEEAFIASGTPYTNYGNSTTIGVGFNSTTGQNALRTLLRFNLTAIPAHVNVISATLNVYQLQVNNTSDDLCIRADFPNASWSETSVTWTNAPDPEGSEIGIGCYDLNLGWKNLDATQVVNYWRTNTNWGAYLLADERSNINFSRYFYSKEQVVNLCSGPYGCMPYLTVTFNNSAIELVKTVGTDPGSCATTDHIMVSAGTAVTYCYEVTNTGIVSLTIHDLDDSELGSILSSFPYSLAPDASVFVTETVSVMTDTVNMAIWTAYNLPGPTDVVSATAVATVTIIIPAIELVKTVGMDPLTCATESSITVPAGTAVTYCYEVTNTGTFTLSTHNLADSELGILLNNFAYDLLPGSSIFVIVTATITQSTVNTAIWTAETEGGQIAAATATASVQVPEGSGLIIYLPVILKP